MKVGAETGGLTMIRILTVLTAALLLSAAPAVAQDAGLARRHALAERYVELVQTDSLGKIVSGVMEEALASEGDMPDDMRAFMREQLPIYLLRMVEQMMTDMTPIYARTYTEEELRALIAFYDTPLGQSIARKDIELGVETNEIMERALLQMMTEFQTKFCAAFECPDEGLGLGVSDGAKH